MSNVTQALFTRLSSDTTLAAMLAVYQNAPAVFAGPKVPEDAARPYVFIPAPMTDTSWDAKVERGRDTEREVWAVTDNAGSMAPCETIAERVRTLLHRGFPLGSINVEIAEARGPSAMPSDESVTALRVSVRLRYNV